MSNQCFPSFNFPFTSSVDLQHSVCDYGRTGPLTILKDEGENLRFFPQKKVITQNKVTFRANKPSLPIKLPNKVCQRYNFDRTVCEHWDSYERRNVENLNLDHHDILYGSVTDLVGQEVKDLSWTSAAHWGRKDKLYSVLDGIRNLLDIPMGTLKNLLQQSFEEKKKELMGRYYGNCLAHQINSFTGNSDIVLAYPSGKFMDKLCLSRMEFCSGNDGMVVQLPVEKDTFTFSERICQVNMVNQSQNNPLIAVRTDYSCSFFQWECDQDHGQESAIKHLGNLACQTKPCSVLVNPFIPGEVVVVMETGSLHLWHEKDSSLEVVKKCSACVAEDFDWYFCEFGPHPRQIIRGNQTNVELLDLRDCSSSSRDLMTLPSPHFFKGDQFSAVQRHPENPYHYFLGTTQFLVIMDERFQQNPVLKWSHSLEEPIKHINVVPGALTNCQDVLLVVGDYKNHEVHCYQYCYGENTPQFLGLAADMGGLPPTSTSNPWKISSYSDWPNIVDCPNKFEILPLVSKQLEEPLLGLTCVQHEDTLSILQLSKAGDLFYQCFKPEINTLIEERDEQQVHFYEGTDIDQAASSRCGRVKPVLAVKDQLLVQDWLKSINQDQIQEDQNSALQKASGTSYGANAQVVRGMTLSRLEDSYPSRMFEVISNTFRAAQTSETTVVTKAHLGITLEVDELKLFDENRPYTDPLGVVLLKNWVSDEQTPVNLTGETEDDPKMEDDMEKETVIKNDPQAGLDESRTEISNTNNSLPTSNSLLKSENSVQVVSSQTIHNNQSILQTPKRECANERNQHQSIVAGTPSSKFSTPQRKSSVKKKKLARVAGF